LSKPARQVWVRDNFMAAYTPSPPELQKNTLLNLPRRGRAAGSPAGSGAWLVQHRPALAALLVFECGDDFRVLCRAWWMQ